MINDIFNIISRSKIFIKKSNFASACKKARFHLTEVMKKTLIQHKIVSVELRLKLVPSQRYIKKSDI